MDLNDTPEIMEINHLRHQVAQQQQQSQEQTAHWQSQSAQWQEQAALYEAERIRQAAQYETVQQTLLSLANRFESVMQAQPAAPQGPPVAIPRPEPATRVTLPPYFEGKLDNKNTIASWIFQARAYLKIARGRTPEDELLYTLSTRLQGAAASWFQQQAMLHGIQFGDPEDLLSALERNYLPPMANREARDRLVRLRQTTTVVAYTESFHELCSQISDLHETERLDKYIRGLKPAIQYQVETAGGEGSTSLDEAIRFATIADRIR